jgi:hypothetical protein
MEKTSDNQNGAVNTLDLSNFSLANIDFVKVKEFILKDQKRACKDYIYYFHLYNLNLLHSFLLILHVCSII